TQDMSLATLEIGGKPRKVIMQAPKNGFFYVLDRATGEFLSGDPFAKVTWATSIDDKGRPVENPGIRYNGKPGLFELWPGARGAHSWLPQSYSPRTGLVYIPVIEGGSYIGDEGVDFAKQPKLGGLAVNMVPDPELPGGHRSFLSAWDPVARKPRWKVGLPGNWPGGTMATAGNLVFQGRIDGQLVAHDARDGREVWSFKTGAPVVAPPISFSINHKQYVTVITGSGASGGGILSTGIAKYRTDYRLPRRVLTFALDGHDALPSEEPAPLKAPPDPEFVDNAEQQTRGATSFGMTGCLVCHGWNAVGGGAAPDLRGSSFPLSKEAFRKIVHDGALVSQGMPQFEEIPDEELEDIRQYLRARMQALTEEQNKPKVAKKAGGGGGTFAGEWEITVESPIGKQTGKGSFKVEGSKISGTQSGAQGSVDVQGTVKGDQATFTGKAYTPFPVTLEFNVTVDGDTFAGEMKTPFGAIPVNAKRI
ncbi:MAG: c-type cytochrome, partial [Polyangiales bacterium]